MSQTHPTSASAEIFHLTGQTAVVTGVSGFLGQVFSWALLEAGARVIMLSRSDRMPPPS